MATLVIHAIALALALVIVAPRVPLRLSLLAYLVIVHFHAPRSAGFSPMGSLGLLNTLKVIVLPAALLLKTRFSGVTLLGRCRPTWAWLALVALATVGIAWSPHPLAGLKSVGYMASYTILVTVFSAAFATDRRGTLRVAMAGVAVGLGIAVLKTHVLGEVVFAARGRLASLGSPQGFASFITTSTALAASAAARPDATLGRARWLVALLPVAAFLTGSRTGFVMTLAVLAYMAIPWSRRDPSFGRAALLAFAAGLLAGAALLVTWSGPNTERRVQETLERHRALHAVGALTAGGSLQDVGTFAYRLGWYSLAVKEIESRGPVELAFGSGTASAPELIGPASRQWSSRGPGAQADANRLVHGAPVRALYEWGLIGAALLLAVLAAICIAAIRAARRLRTLEAQALLAGAGALVVFVFLTNAIAGAGVPSGTGIALLIAAIVTVAREDDVDRHAVDDDPTRRRSVSPQATEPETSRDSRTGAEAAASPRS